MNKRVAVIISPNWRDYAKNYLADCMAGIRTQDYPGEIGVFITDNETSKESYRLLRSLAPEAEIHRNENNDGFAKGCNDCMKLALERGYDYVFLVSIHSVLEPGCVGALAAAAETDPRIAVAQARMMLAGGDNLVASLGNDTHFLGFGYCRGYRERWTGQARGITDIFYASGASMFFRREAIEAAGPFDEEYWMYNEDQELPWRLRLAGWRVVLAPEAVARTKYEFKRSIKKFYWMDRNRIISMFLCYKLWTLLLILPAFFAMEAGLAVFAFGGGWFFDKLRVWGYFLKPRTWAYLARARRRNQALRRVGDSDIVKMITGRIWYQEIGDWKLRLANPAFELYWWVVRRIICW